MKFRVSLLAKHWTYKTLDKCINAAVAYSEFADLKI